MAVKTKDVVVDYNQLGNPGLTVDANGKNAIRIDNLPNSYNLQNGKLKENGTLVFEDITNSKTLIIENPETIRYIKTHYQKVGKKETYQLVDIYENDFVLNEKTITEYDAKLTATGTNFKDNMDFSSYVPSESTTKGLTINGGNGSDTIKATDYNDVIKGGTGNDSIEGLQGDDTIYGDAGNDFIRGGDGNDVIYGGNEEDDIMGGKGNDTITGGSGVTHIGHTRGDGDDVIYLTKGENLNLNLDRGNEGSSYGLLTKSEVSYKYSDDKKDLIIYSDKNDASKGSITLKNFATKDILNNATKKTPDTSSIKIHLSEGAVDLKDATFEDMSVKTTDIKSNFTGTWLNDDIDASEYALYTDKAKSQIDNNYAKKGLTIDSGAGNDKIIGTNYSDTLKGGNGNDEIHGGKGNDKIYGGDGINKLYGDDGNDLIQGGKDVNIIYGGSGNDTIYGGNEYNESYGGEGNDVIKGGNGSDFIYGGKDNDTITGGKGNNEIVFAKGDGHDVINLTKNEELIISLYENDYNPETNHGTFVDPSTIKYEYSDNKKDLIIYFDEEKTQGSLTLKNYVQNNVTKGAVLYLGQDESGNDIFVDLKKDIEILTKPESNFTGTWLDDDIDASGYTLYKDKAKMQIDDNYARKGLILDGGNGNDKITGTNYSDTLKGGNGNDSIEGGSGNDIVYGGNDKDFIRGGGGNDTIYGDNGDDIIDGQSGDDVIYGGNGDDNITGGMGNDTITGGAGTNTINYTKGNGNDVINLTKGENFNLKISGTTFDDLSFVKSSDGKDLLIYTDDTKSEYITIKNFIAKNITKSAKMIIGDDEYDLNEVSVESVVDKNFAGTRFDDNINASATVLFKKLDKTSYIEKYISDAGLTLNGGVGDDTVVGTNYSDVIKGGVGDDDLRGGNGFDTLYGENGNDNIYGDDCDDEIYGGNGNDVIDGGEGDDEIDGGNDDDIIYGGLGDDEILGGNGNDKIDGGEDDDYINGGNGDDTIKGGTGNDTIIGGAGRNTLEYTVGDGNDVIYLTKGENFKLVISGSGITDINDLSFMRDDNDLLIYTDNSNDEEFIRIKDFAKKDVTNNATKKTPDTSSVMLEINGNEYNLRTEEHLACTTLANGNYTGTYLREEIDASGLTLFKKVGNSIVEKDFKDSGLTLNGVAGDDTIKGSKYSDILNCGNGDDLIEGGKGNDTITGGAGTNTIVYRHDDGNDVVNITKGEDLIIALPNVNNFNDIIFEIAPNGKDLIIRANNDNRDEFMTIKDYVTKDILNSGKFLLGDSGQYEHDFSEIVITVNTTKNYTGTRLKEKIDASGATKGVTVNSGAGNDTVSGSDYNDVIKGTSGDKKFSGGKGNDTIYGTNGYNNNLHGGEDDDKIYAGNLSDSIYGDAGNDFIKAGDGDDSIWGDTLGASESDGNDTIYGEGGNDKIYGNGGDDYIDGGLGGDSIKGGTGDDTIYGGDGDDEIWGEGYDDVIYGGNGDDTIYGGDGSDLIYGDAGDDSLSGGNSDDTIYGGVGNDIIEGYIGDDYIEGGKGNDKITGGEGANYIVYNKGDGDDFITLTKGEQFKLELKDVRSIDDVEFATASNNRDYIIYVDKNNHSAGSITLEDFAERDVTNNKTETSPDTSYVKLVINGTEYDLRRKDVTVSDDYIGSCIHENIDASSATKGLNINGMDGRDTINGSNYNDTIYGGAGNDSIKGNAGDNYIYGDDGNDTIYGGTGNVSIEGGAGDDKLYGGSGSCTIYGNTGNDTIWGSSTNGIIYGDEGNDELYGNQGDDKIYGGDGDDYINGEQGNDTLYGGAGNDTLDGGYNSDTLYGGEGDDTYKVYFEKNAMNSVIVDESGTNDVVQFTEWPIGPNTCTKDKLHVVFNVSRDFNKSTDTISWVNILDDTNFTSWKLNPFGDFDGVKIQDNAIENIYSSDNYNLTSADISSLAESVASWLTSNDYLDVNDVLTNEKQVGDIDDLMVILDGSIWRYQS